MDENVTESKLEINCSILSKGIVRSNMTNGRTLLECRNSTEDVWSLRSLFRDITYFYTQHHKCGTGSFSLGAFICNALMEKTFVVLLIVPSVFVFVYLLYTNTPLLIMLCKMVHTSNSIQSVYHKN